MATEKTAYTPVEGGPSPPSYPGQPPFPVAFDNMVGPNMFGGPAPGGMPAPGGLPAPAGLPFPPPTAFGPRIPGAFGMGTDPQGGSGYGVNPASSPYSPPGQGFNGNFSGKCCVCFFFFNVRLSSYCDLLILMFQMKFTITRMIHHPFTRIKTLILD